MNKLTTAKRIQIVSALVEGVGIRATARLCDVTKGAVSKLLADVGTIAAEYHNVVVRNLKSRRIQCDEIWSFCYAKERAIRIDPTVKKRNKDAGDVWTWTAIDADSKMCVTYFVGSRTAEVAHAFMHDVANRLTHRVQLTTDAFPQYLTAVEGAFGIDVDYAQLHKIYTAEPSGKYSPPICIGCEKREIMGDPDPDHISTSYVERSNLTMRMHMRRFTRLTNGHSKKVVMHQHAVALHFLYYNFAKIHETLRVTPAMAAGLTASPWTIGDIIGLLEKVEAAA